MVLGCAVGVTLDTHEGKLYSVRVFLCRRSTLNVIQMSPFFLEIK
jgi:hypothetical protein